jgi:hypothetical protein
MSIRSHLLGTIAAAALVDIYQAWDYDPRPFDTGLYTYGYGLPQQPRQRQATVAAPKVRKARQRQRQARRATRKAMQS